MGAGEMTNSDMETSTGDGRQVYSRYAALWPLVSMGLVGAEDGGTGADGGLDFELWKSIADDAKPVRVAIIDTSVAIEHPNLNGHRTDCRQQPEGSDGCDTVIDCSRAIDFGSARLGSFPYYGAQRTIAQLLSRQRDDNWPASGDVPLPDLDYGCDFDLPESCMLTADLFDALKARLSPGEKALHDTVLPATDPRFSTHGTAIAGLVGARPARVRLASAETRGRTGLPFSGANPFCSLIPISTSFDPDPEQLILALLYASLAGADVILIPRDFPDPFRTPPLLEEELRLASERVSISNREKTLWNELHTLTLALSRHIPIVCAAGNSGDENIIYPANLAAEDNGIICVGAANSNGRIAGYSSRGDAITVFAPSSDGERLDREETRLDLQNPGYPLFPDRIRTANDANENAFSHRDVISTDIPGRFGYNGSDPVDPYERTGTRHGALLLRDFGSFYCRFGGTSAASALAAGFLSLGITADKIRCGRGTAAGIAAKAWLLENTRQLDGGQENVLFWKR
ncbi:S8 family serine peptidase [Rhodobacterales bacterium]|nr:S8 family serine peptidase [Rhodobacterales bacterium]